MRNPFEDITSKAFHPDPKERRAWWSWRITRYIFLWIAVLFAIFIVHWAEKDSQVPQTEEPGVIQDGIYYFYKGSRTVAPSPVGLCAYTPGQEPEALVTDKDYHLNPTVPFWNVNHHGLYFIDDGSDSLFRMDLDTRAVTQLYSRSAEAYLTDLSLTALYLYDDYIVLSRTASQQVDYLTLDPDGRVLDWSKEPPPELSEPQPGTPAYEVQRLGLPATKEDIFYTYLDVSDRWLFYIASIPKYVEGHNRSLTELWAMDVETEERYLVQDEITLHQVVTDGQWLYDCNRGTDCYQLEYNDQGIPCGLTLIEERI